MITGMKYRASEIPTDVLENIIKDIAKRGTGATPALSGWDMYHIIAREYAKSINDPCHWLASLECTFESVRGSVYSIAHCDVVDKILIKYFNACKDESTIYWFTKKTSLNTIKRWLRDDFRGTMENPF